MSYASGCQVYYLVLSYALLLALLGRLASEQTALAGFTPGVHHFKFGALAQRRSEGIAAQIVWSAPSRERYIQLGLDYRSRRVLKTSPAATAYLARQARARANGRLTVLRLRPY
jgi:hypothetical protein